MELKEFDCWAWINYAAKARNSHEELLELLQSKFSKRICCLISIYLAKWGIKILANKWPEENLVWEYARKLITESEAIFEDSPDALHPLSIKPYAKRISEESIILKNHPSMPICFLTVFHIVAMSKTTDKPKKEEEHELLISNLYWTVDEIVNHNWAYSTSSADQRELEIQFYRLQVSQLLGLFLPLENWNANWHNVTTTQLAKTIYNTKDWSLCPILADALMDVGCDDDYVLWLLKEQHHLFGRGVWIIDHLAGNYENSTGLLMA